MPQRIVKIPAKRLMHWMSDHQQATLGILSFALVIALAFAVAGWTAARNAEQRVTKIEVESAAEHAATMQGEKISKVVSCFNAASTRPLLTTVLRAMAAREPDAVVRTAINLLISNYERSAVIGVKGQPTEEKCRTLARKLGVKSTPYDPSLG